MFCPHSLRELGLHRKLLEVGFRVRLTYGWWGKLEFGLEPSGWGSLEWRSYQNITKHTSTLGHSPLSYSQISGQAEVADI